MAELILKVGALTATKTASDVKAQEVLGDFLAVRVPGDVLAGMSNQEQLDLVVQAIAGWLGGASRDIAREEAEAAIVVTPTQFED